MQKGLVSGHIHVQSMCLVITIRPEQEATLPVLVSLQNNVLIVSCVDLLETLLWCGLVRQGQAKALWGLPRYTGIRSRQ